MPGFRWPDASRSRLQRSRRWVRVDKGNVDFAELYQMACRADDAKKPEDIIRTTWPHTVRVGLVANVDVRYVLEQDDRSRTHHISMPGSHNIMHWIEDFDIFLKPETRSGIPLHRGFEKAAVAVLAELRPHLKPGYRVHLSGYSMGGGVAIVLAMYLIEEGSRLAGW